MVACRCPRRACTRTRCRRPAAPRVRHTLAEHGSLQQPEAQPQHTCRNLRVLLPSLPLLPPGVGDSIVEFAKAKGADLVVLGSRGMGSMQR